MEKTFPLPNAVSCSDGIKSKTAHTSLNRTKITTNEYKKVDTLSTSSLSRPSKVTPDNIKSDKLPVDSMTLSLAKQATALRRLKWISAFLAISTVINSATFGGLTHSLMEREENNERLFAQLEDAVLMITPPNEAYFSAVTSDIQTRLLNLESNQTQDRIGADRRILNLESYQNHDRTEFQSFSTMLDSIGSNLSTSIATCQLNSDRLTKIESQMMILEPNQTETHVEIKEMRTSVEKLESDFDAHITAAQVDSNRLSIIESHMEKERQSLRNISESLQTDISDQNTSIQIATERLTQLEQDTFEDRTNIVLQESKIMQVEADLAAQNVSLKAHSLRIEELELQGVVHKDLISNHTASLQRLETNLRETKINLQKGNSDNQAQTSRILELELQANDTINKFEDFGNRLTNATETLHASIAWLQKKVGQGLHSNSSLDEQITEMEATISIVLNNHTSRITQLEYSSSVAEDTIAAQTSKLAEIETNRQSDVAEIQAHDARILGLEQAVSDIHSDTLKKLELKIGFTAEGNTIDPVTDIVIFNYLKSAYGTGYSTSTGVFTCNQPGLYYFSSSLVKTRDYDNSVDRLNCRLYINSDEVTLTVIDPTDGEVDYGSYETSMFYITHLAIGDQVYVKCVAGSLEWYSTFSGFMIVSDN